MTVLSGLSRAGAVLLALLGGTAGAAAPLPPSAPAFAERLQACAACHGERGHSDAESYYPSIAGKPAGYLYQQLLNFREGRRHNQVMRGMLAWLSDEYLRDIARYYAQQPPAIAPRGSGAAAALLARGRQIVETGDPERGLPACTGCHGSQLLGAEPAMPGLLGLSQAYLAAQLGAWREHSRQAAAPDCMAAIARKLTPGEITAVTAWIASQPYPQNPTPQPPARPLPMDCGGLR